MGPATLPSMSWPLPTLLFVAVGILVVVSLALLRRWSLSHLLQLVVTAIITLAVLMAIGVAWSALWSILQRWGA